MAVAPASTDDAMKDDADIAIRRAAAAVRTLQRVAQSQATREHQRGVLHAMYLMCFWSLQRQNKRTQEAEGRIIEALEGVAPEGRSAKEYLFDLADVAVAALCAEVGGA